MPQRSKFDLVSIFAVGFLILSVISVTYIATRQDFVTNFLSKATPKVGDKNTIKYKENKQANEAADNARRASNQAAALATKQAANPVFQDRTDGNASNFNGPQGEYNKLLEANPNLKNVVDFDTFKNSFNSGTVIPSVGRTAQQMITDGVNNATAQSNAASKCAPGTVAVYAANDYRKCDDNGLWVADSNLKITDLTIVPEYLKDQYNQALSDLQKGLTLNNVITGTSPNTSVDKGITLNQIIGNAPGTGSLVNNISLSSLPVATPKPQSTQFTGNKAYTVTTDSKCGGGCGSDTCVTIGYGYYGCASVQRADLTNPLTQAEVSALAAYGKSNLSGTAGLTVNNNFDSSLGQIAVNLPSNTATSLNPYQSQQLNTYLQKVNGIIDSIESARLGISQYVKQHTTGGGAPMMDELIDGLIGNLPIIGYNNIASTVELGLKATTIPNAGNVINSDAFVGTLLTSWSGMMPVVDSSNRLFYQMDMTPEEAAAYNADPLKRLPDAVNVGLFATLTADQIGGAFAPNIRQAAGLEMQNLIRNVSGKIDASLFPRLNLSSANTGTRYVSEEELLQLKNLGANVGSTTQDITQSSVDDIQSTVNPYTKLQNLINTPQESQVVTGGFDALAPKVIRPLTNVEIAALDASFPSSNLAGMSDDMLFALNVKKTNLTETSLLSKMNNILDSGNSLSGISMKNLTVEQTDLVSQLLKNEIQLKTTINNADKIASGLTKLGLTAIGTLTGSAIYANRDSIASYFSEMTQAGYYSPTIGTRIINRDGKWYRVDNGQEISGRDALVYIKNTEVSPPLGQRLELQYVIVDKSTFESEEWKSLESKIHQETLSDPYNIAKITESVHNNVLFSPAKTYVNPVSMFWVDKFLTVFADKNLKDQIKNNWSICIEFAIVEQAYLSKIGIDSEIVTANVITSDLGSAPHAFLVIKDNIGDKYVLDPTNGYVEKYDDYIYFNRVTGIEILPSNFVIIKPRDVPNFTINEPSSSPAEQFINKYIVDSRGQLLPGLTTWAQQTGTNIGQSIGSFWKQMNNIIPQKTESNADLINKNNISNNSLTIHAPDYQRKDLNSVIINTISGIATSLRGINQITVDQKTQNTSQNYQNKQSNFSVFMQTGNNTVINKSGDTLAMEGCAPSTAYNILSLLGKNPDLNEIIKDFYWNCVGEECTTSTDATLFMLQQEGIKGVYDNYESQRILDANQLKNYTGVLVYGGTVTSPKQKVLHVAGFSCQNGNCVSLDSYFSDGKPVPCNIISSSLVKCGDAEYRVGNFGGIPDAFYPVTKDYGNLQTVQTTLPTTDNLTKVSENNQNLNSSVSTVDVGNKIADAAISKMDECQQGYSGYYNACYGEPYHGSILKPGDIVNTSFNENPSNNPDSLYWCTKLVIDSAKEAGININPIYGALNMSQDFRDKKAFISESNAGLNSNQPQVKIGMVAFVSKKDPVTGNYQIGHVGIVSDVKIVEGNVYVTIIQSNAGTTQATYELDDQGRLATVVQTNSGEKTLYISGFGDLTQYAQNQ